MFDRSSLGYIIIIALWTLLLIAGLLIYEKVLYCLRVKYAIVIRIRRVILMQGLGGQLRR